MPSVGMQPPLHVSVNELLWLPVLKSSKQNSQLNARDRCPTLEPYSTVCSHTHAGIHSAHNKPACMCSAFCKLSQHLNMTMHSTQHLLTKLLSDFQANFAWIATELQIRRISLPVPANTVGHVAWHCGITESQRTGINHGAPWIEISWNHTLLLNNGNITAEVLPRAPFPGNRTQMCTAWMDEQSLKEDHSACEIHVLHGCE